MNLSQATNDPNKYALFSVVSHEVDEVLAFGTALNGFRPMARPLPPGPSSRMTYSAMMLPATGSFNTTVTTVQPSAIFSLDGIIMISPSTINNREATFQIGIAFSVMRYPRCRMLIPSRVSLLF